MIGGGTPDTNNVEYWGNDIQWFTPTEIGHQKYVTTSIRTISKLGLSQSSAKLLPAGSILLSSRATIGECSINTLECTTNQGFQSLIPKAGQSAEFIYYLATKLKPNFIKHASGSTFLEISNSEVKSTSCYIPSNAEQNIISEFLSLLDKRIEKEKQIMLNLKSYKRGVLSLIFNDKIPNCYLSDILQKSKAGGTPQSSNSAYYDGSIPFLSIADMTKQGKYIYSTEKHISELGLQNSTAWLVPKNSLILSMYASYGLVAINKVPIATSQAMFNMILKQDIDVEYVYYYLSYLATTNYYIKMVSTGTQPNLNAEKVKAIPLYIPSDAEQNNIVKLLQSYDNRLEKEEQILANLQVQKTALLQQLFI